MVIFSLRSYFVWGKALNHRIASNNRIRSHPMRLDGMIQSANHRRSKRSCNATQAHKFSANMHEPSRPVNADVIICVGNIYHQILNFMSYHVLILPVLFFTCINNTFALRNSFLINKYDSELRAVLMEGEKTRARIISRKSLNSSPIHWTYKTNFS